MIAGRLRWLAPGKKTAPNALAFFEFATRHARPHRSRQAAARLAPRRRAAAPRSPRSTPGGIDVMTATRAAFAARLHAENHTVKRALTDPRLFSGIGNAYSDEILHRARAVAAGADAIARRGDDRRACSTRRGRRSPNGPTRLAREAGDWSREKVTAFHSGDGGARPLRPALPGLRRAGAAHRPRRQRDELLRALPDRRQAASPTARCRGSSRASWPKHIDELL